MSFENLSNEKLEEFLNKLDWTHAEDRWSAWEQIDVYALSNTHCLVSHLLFMRKGWSFGPYTYQLEHSFLKRYSPDIRPKPKPEWKVGKVV